MTRYIENERLIWFKPSRSKNKPILKFYVIYSHHVSDMRSIVKIESTGESLQVMTDHLMPLHHYMGRKSDVK